MVLYQNANLLYYTLSRHRVRRLLWHVPSVSIYLSRRCSSTMPEENANCAMWKGRMEIVWCHCVCVLCEWKCKTMMISVLRLEIGRWRNTMGYGTIQHDGVHAIWKCCVHNTFGYFRNRFCTVDETINTRTMNILSCWSSVVLYQLDSHASIAYLPPFSQMIFSIEITIIWDWVPFRPTMHQVHQVQLFNRFGVFGCDNQRSNCSRSCYKSCEYLPNLEQTITQNNPKNK